VSVSVLDTSACAAVMRHDSEIEALLRSRSPGDVALVPPVVAEIEYGIHRLPASTRKRELLERELSRLLQTIRVLEWTATSSTEFGEIKSQLERDGTPIDDMDVAIAAVAMSHGAEVVTANLVHFARINGLTARHW
jgi:predicted nucleic acid-binding protein